ncbi:hypothetical protein Droror1_Dr00014845 [Drosera rotundifolia]
MEGGLGGVYGYVHESSLLDPLMSRRSSMTLSSSSIDRFLLARKGRVDEEMVKDHYFCSLDARDGYVGSWLTPSSHLVDIGDASYVPSDGWRPPHDDDVGSRSLLKPSKTKRKRASSDAGIMLIKGAWSEEEDRKLIELIEQHGERKWAQIAKNLEGRVGKQCRERWNNHLRPDIKKSSWSEEEERLLIEAHEECGNKWAKIAQRIPGRTENSIKNHWNATKRKQNTKRKNKRTKAETGKPESSILPDYIKSLYPNNSATVTIMLTTTMTSDASNFLDDPTVHYSEQFLPGLEDLDSPSSLIVDASDQHQAELLFMQNLFKDDPRQSSSNDHDHDCDGGRISMMDPKPVLGAYPSSSSSTISFESKGKASLS